MMNEQKPNRRPTIRARILHSILNHSSVSPEEQSRLLINEGLVIENLYAVSYTHLTLPTIYSV